MQFDTFYSINCTKLLNIGGDWFGLGA